MKAKLIKRDDGYNLAIEQPQGRLLEATCSPSQQLILDKSGASTKHKLSKQNCDELFGVVDVEMVAKKNYPQIPLGKKGYVAGFNKAMALNKDKRFTVEDMRTAMLNAIEMTDFQKEQFRKDNDYHIALDIIQSLQQPTEIDVVIVTEDSIGIGDKYTPEPKPLFDSEGCLILKRK